MKCKYCRFVTCFLISISVIAIPAHSSAQFLKKLSKGLEKVNKGLEKVNNELDNATKPSSKKEKSAQPAAQKEAEVRESVSLKAVTPEFGHPYITPRTKYMQLARMDKFTVSDVYDNVFTIDHGAGVYSFWTIDGKNLFGPEWTSSITGVGERPRFDTGVAVAVSKTRSGSNGRPVYSLLYMDGSVRELSPNWVKVSQFYDGLALVKEEIGRKTSYFYINPSGEKVFPTLKIYGGAVVRPMRPLCDGLRAVEIYGTMGTRWGFINADGKLVIPGRYDDVQDFHGGYCWVKSKGQLGTSLIDINGNEVYTTSSYNPGPVNDGIFYIDSNGKTIYYDVTGKELAAPENGSSFYNGHAYVGDYNVSMVDTAFRVLRRYSDKVLNGVTTSQHGPVFEPYGLATFGSSYVMDDNGNIVLSEWAKDYNNYYMGNFGQFQRSGYAKLDVGIKCSGFANYQGLMDATGNVVWLFGTEGQADISELPRKPIHIEPRDSLTDSIPKVLKPVKPGPPVGPKVWTSPKFSISVKQKGEGTVRLSQTTGIGYGKMVTLTATPAEGWALSGIESDPCCLIRADEPFAVTSDMTVSVDFIKEEVIDPVSRTGCFQGVEHIQFNEAKGGISDDIIVYAELSKEADINSPYGERTSGFIVLMFDPTKRYIDKDFATYVFAAPLKVIGSQTDPQSGREWLVADGGSVTFGNLKITPGDPFMSLFMNLTMAFDGHSSPNCIPRRYRIEILDRDPETDAFTFGELQTYSTKEGRWVGAQDKSVRQTTHGRFVTKTDKGLSHDFVAGVRMEPSQKRNDVQWYPPLLWYDGNETTLRAIIEQMGNAYRVYKSDYEEMFGK